MQINSLPQQIADLKNQNEQLKTKYKKSLEQLMHILSINNTMKEHIDKCTHNDARVRQIQNLVQELSMKIQMQKIHIKELQSVKSGLQARVASLQVAIKDAELQKERRKNQLGQTYKKLKFEEQKRKLLEHVEQIGPNRLKAQQELNLIKKQNQKLSKIVLKCKGFQTEKQLLLAEIQNLKEERKHANQRHVQQQQRSRIQILRLQNQIMEIASNQRQKTKQLESKYLILQAQLANYQKIECYIQQSKQIQQEQVIFNSIRSQIQRITDNFSTYYHQNSLINQSKEQEEKKIKIIADLETQVQRHRLEAERQRLIIEQLQKRAQEILILQEKIKVVEAQRQDLYQKNNVLEAFVITQKHRVGFQVSERIEQFERRVHLLLEEDAKSISGLGGLQQILILKSYVKELSELLWSEKKKQEKLKQKNQHLKEKIRQIEHKNTLKIVEYNKKIANYDNLIQKLYSLLQQKVLQVPHQDKDKDFHNAITRYEEKMLRMSDELIKLKRKNEALEQINRTRPVSTISEEEYEKLNHVTANLQADFQKLQMQYRLLLEENKQLTQVLKERENEAQSLIKEKESKITKLSHQLETYGQQLKAQNQKIGQIVKKNNQYENQIRHQHSQLQKYIQTNNYLLDKQDNSDSLLKKISILENQIKKMAKQHQGTFNQENKRMLENLNHLESKINLQNQQMQAYKQEITNLYTQLQSSKIRKQALQLQHHNLVYLMRNQIEFLEQEKKEESYLNKQQPLLITKLREECQRLQNQNKILVAQVKKFSQEAQARRQSYEKEKHNQKSAKQVVSQLEDFNNQVMTKSTKEAKELNALILSLRTQNLAIKNQLQEKQTVISELKHQIYTKQLKMQKEKSRENLLILREQSDKSNQQYQKLLLAFTLVSARLDALSLKLTDQDTEVQTFTDKLTQRNSVKVEKLDIPLENITSLDRSNLEQGDKKNQLLSQSGYFKVFTTKNNQTLSKPISVVDSNWNEEYQKSKEKQKYENADFHASSGSFKMIKQLKQSLRSVQVPTQEEKKDGSAKKQ